MIIFNHMVKYSTNTLNATFGALADPTRRAILQRLAGGEQTVMELAVPFEMSLPAVSKHLRVLEHAGLLIQIKDGRIRRCRLVAKPMKEASKWIEHYKTFWEAQFDSLEQFFIKNQKKDK